LCDVGSPREWTRLFGSLSSCISGRLHQVLPAAALGIPSCLVVPGEAGKQDTRYTLLEDLRLPMITFDQLREGTVERYCRFPSAERVSALNEALTAFLRRTTHGLAAEANTRSVHAQFSLGKD